MKYIDEYRDSEKVKSILKKIENTAIKKITLMEVCGGHTMSIHKFGIKSLLPKNVNLISGPGCPVCVTGRKYIDHSIALSKLDNVIIATYGDLIRVPGSTTDLMNCKAKGADVRIVYSTMKALEIAKQYPNKKLVFLGIGFETTAPATASALKIAKRDNINNFFVLSAHKIMPPAMAALIDAGVTIDGYIGPGHVSTIAGADIYEDIPKNYGLSCVVSGFEPLDILQSIYMLVKQIIDDKPKVEIQYSRVVKYFGNTKAKSLLEEVFELRDDEWRGLGIIKKSGLKPKQEYSQFDAEQMIPVEVEKTIEPKGCICGDILKGTHNPKDCKLFAKSCKPSNPVGACMVSNEGACNAFYKYDRN